MQHLKAVPHHGRRDTQATGGIERPYNLMLKYFWPFPVAVCNRPLVLSNFQCCRTTSIFDHKERTELPTKSLISIEFV
jgi:hypothetical protein